VKTLGISHPGRLVAATVATAALLATAGCGGGDDAGDASGGGDMSLNIYYTAVTADYLGLWIAEEQGIFEKHGLDVTLSEVEDASGIPALLSGDMQIGATAPTSVLASEAAGSDLTMIACTDPTLPFQFMATSDVTDVQDLAGKNVGVSSAGSGSDFATRAGLQAVGLDPSKVNILPLGSKSNRVAALTSGQIQGGVDNPPTSVGLQKQGLHVLFDLADLDIQAPNIVYTAQQTWLDGNPEAAQAFADSLVEALDVQRTDQATSVKVLEKYFESDDQDALNQAWEYFNKILPDEPTMAPDLFDSLIDFNKESIPGLEDLDVSKHIDNSFIEKASDKG
jgi:NitT/TauT family transport system substrate-binding protein